MAKHNPGNILMISNYPSGTAYAWWLMEHFWVILAEQFAQRGARAFVSYPKITTLSPTITAAPLSAVELTLPWTNAKQRERALSFIRENQIRHIYFTDQAYFNSQYVWLRAAGVRRIAIHDHTPGDRPVIGGIKGLGKALRNHLLGVTADAVLCVSELMRQRSIKNGRIPASRCHVVQNGVHPIICKAEDKTTIRQTMSLSEETVLVVTSGRAHPYKRFDFIIEVARQVFAAAPNLNLRFLLIGDGPAMQTLEDQVHTLGLADKVKLLGFRDDVRKLLCAADIAIHAALGEGFSLAITEYMSAGLAVLVPNIPSVQQAIEHKETGIVYAWDQPACAATAIISLATNQTERHRLGLAAKAKSDIHYSLDNCSRELIQAAEIAFQLPKIAASS